MITLFLSVLFAGSAMQFGIWAGQDSLHPSRHVGERLVCENDSAKVREERIELKTCWKVTVEQLPNEVSEIESIERKTVLH